MFLRRASEILKRIRLNLPTVDRLKGSSVSLQSSVIISNSRYTSGGSGAGGSRSKFIWGVVLSGQAVVLGVHCCPSLAEEASVADLANRNDGGEADVIELQRIEDGSVASNEHTVKWRIFTDKGRELFLQGKLDDAETCFSSALREAREGFGERDPHVASSCNNLAELYRVKRAFDKAEPLYLEAIRILEESFNPEDIRVGAALHNLGQFYVAQRKLEEARVCYERALKIKGRVLGYAHLDYAETMYHLGKVLYLQGNESDSNLLIQDSIRILEEGGMGESEICIRRLRYLAQIMLRSNRPSEAENLQRKILHILELVKGWESLDTVIAAEGLALTLQSLGGLIDAQELLERCLATRKFILSDDHIQVAANMLHLARIAMLKFDHIRKVELDKARDELDRATNHLDDSMRISRLVLDRFNENKGRIQSKGPPKEDERGRHIAFIILLQSIDTKVRLETAKSELQESKVKDAHPIEAERAFRECISLFKESGLRRALLNSRDVQLEYLSCLKHLLSLMTGSGESQLSRETLQELKDEIKRVEAMLSPSRKHGN
ncbi:hypothetical protein QJS10_CPB19g01485 [Acorus calamus]|uniref:Kinesin light chain n=1 Tax=Acorus calamus TaxID=4465 RepID=A0AAV9CFB0_ACOCL|nr:hypothetical protein QJS10_CPB19g01485 [Acorus calamus]